MRDITKKDIARAIVIINANFGEVYSADDQDILINSWKQMLKGIPYEIFNEALIRVMRHAEFYPKIGTIINECERIMSAGDKTPEELWEELAGAVRTADRLLEDARYPYIGEERRVDAAKAIEDVFNAMSEPLRKYCVSVDGLKALCNDGLKYERTRFMGRIDNIREVIRTEQSLPPEIKLINEELGKGMRLIG